MNRKKHPTLTLASDLPATLNFSQLAIDHDDYPGERATVAIDIRQAIRGLRFTERLILTLSYGIGVERPLDDEEVSAMFGTSTESVRDARWRGLRTLRRRRVLEMYDQDVGPAGSS